VLAGVYAMSRLADDWTDQRQQCVDVLCAYLRLSQSAASETSQEIVRAWSPEVQRRRNPSSSLSTLLPTLHVPRLLLIEALRSGVGGCWAGEPACEDWQELGGRGARLYGVDDQPLVGVMRW
jgi:hypothetical protein